VKINPNEKQLVVYPLRASKGKQLFLEVTLSSVCLQFGQTSRMAVANSSTSRFGKASKNITDGQFVPYITGCVENFNINMK
jgi:hypothetical protein